MSKNYCEISLGGDRYMMNFYPASRSLSILVRITKMLGAPAGALFSGDEKKQKDEEKLLDSFEKQLPQVLALLGDRLDERATVELFKDILEGLTVNNETLDFDKHFSGKPGTMFKVLLEVLKFQYGDLKNVFGDLLKAQAGSPPHLKKA